MKVSNEEGRRYRITVRRTDEARPLTRFCTTGEGRGEYSETSALLNGKETLGSGAGVNSECKSEVSYMYVQHRFRLNTSTQLVIDTEYT